MPGCAVREERGANSAGPGGGVAIEEDAPRSSIFGRVQLPDISRDAVGRQGVRVHPVVADDSAGNYHDAEIQLRKRLPAHPKKAEDPE